MPVTSMTPYAGWPRLPSWAAALWAALWGAALLLPAVVGLGDTHHPVWCGGGLLVAFALFIVCTIDANARAGLRRPDLWPAVLALAVICGVVALDPGLAWGTLPILVAVATAVGTRLRWAPWLVAVIAVAGLLIEGARDGDWEQAIWGTGLTTLLAGLLTCAFSWLSATITELHATRRELAAVAVSEERLRFARDLHDLLGHGLSVISIKAQAARRSIRTDPAAAEGHIRDVEVLAQDALADVREAVQGFRRSNLDSELSRAAAALRAAGISTTIIRDDESLTVTQRELLAWVVREGATNVLRHAHARHASIRTSSVGGVATVIIEDDGGGPDADEDDRPADDERLVAGTGIAGLRERLTSSGGRLNTHADAGGFRLTVEVPHQPPVSAFPSGRTEGGSQA